jgi:hypothetical protein
VAAAVADVTAMAAVAVMTIAVVIVPEAGAGTDSRCTCISVTCCMLVFLLTNGDMSQGNLPFFYTLCMYGIHNVGCIPVMMMERQWLHVCHAYVAKPALSKPK